MNDSINYRVPGGGGSSSLSTLTDLDSTTAGTTVGDYITQSDGAGNFTLIESTIGYDGLKSDLKSTVELGAGNNIDWDLGVVFGRDVLTTATTFTFSNVRDNKTVSLLVKGEFAITLPVSVDLSQISDYDGTKWNKIQFESNVTAGVTKIWATLITEA